MPVKDTRFQPGNKLGGRTKGARNKLSEAFLLDVYGLWQERGNQALRDMLEDSPTKFCQLVAQTMPRDFQVSLTQDTRTWVINAQPELSHEQWVEKYAPKVIDCPVGEVESSKP